MQPEILRPGAAKPIAVETGQRVAAAAFQFGPENVCRHGGRLQCWATDKISMIGYWLIPVDEQRAQLAAIIREIAHKYEATAFDPHVTLYSTDDSEEHARRVLDQIAAQHQAFELRVSGIGHSEKFTKTLFVQFANNAEAQRLSAAIQNSSQSGSNYEFDPHLSLLYAHISPGINAAEAEAVHLPFDRVSFDSVAAINFPQQIKSRADVEAWQTIATAKLAG
jgi:2'-5' RNA ligase